MPYFHKLIGINFYQNNYFFKISPAKEFNASMSMGSNTKFSVPSSFSGIN